MVLCWGGWVWGGEMGGSGWWWGGGDGGGWVDGGWGCGGGIRWGGGCEVAGWGSVGDTIGLIFSPTYADMYFYLPNG